MELFTSATGTLKVFVIALGVWGVINLLEEYGNDNPSANPSTSCIVESICYDKDKSHTGVKL